jgi:hypothetical protein
MKFCLLLMLACCHSSTFGHDEHVSGSGDFRDRAVTEGTRTARGTALADALPEMAVLRLF